MSWIEIEKAFNQAALFSFTRAKALLVFSSLILCGLLIVFCRALAFGASDWMALSLGFIPIFIGTAVLLPVGALVAKMHQCDRNKQPLELKELLSASFDALVGTAYLSLPPLLSYLLLWIAMGIFFLFKQIPGLGLLFSTLFSFAPFMLILCSILLCLFNLGLLFFASPAAVFAPSKHLHLAKQIFSAITKKPFISIALFLIALAPLLFCACLLTFAAFLTNLSFSFGSESWTLALEWFFIMLPFAALLTPAVIFFFNFAAESYPLLNRRAETR